jgi:hypothetical protein
MPSVSNEVLNDLFINRLDTPEGREKTAAKVEDWIHDRLREEAFVRNILTPRKVTRSDLQVSVNHDTLVKIVEVEPQSRAMTMTFRGQPDVRYYRAARFEVPFHEVASERMEQTTQELLAYQFPITEVLRRNVLKDIQEVEDHTFLTHTEAACQSLQLEALGLALGTAFTVATAFTARNVADGSVPEVGKVKGVDAVLNTVAANDADGATEALVFPIQKDDFVKLFKLFPGSGGVASRLRCEQVLICETDYEDLALWTLQDLGDVKVGAITIDGWKFDTVLGRKIVKTIKTDILRPGNIYGFAAEKFLGGFLIFGKTEFFADKERNRVSWEAWEDIGMYIGNVAGVRKLELYAGSVEMAGAAGLQATRAPLAENQLGAENNQVDDGGTFPSVVDF